MFAPLMRFIQYGPSCYSVFLSPFLLKLSRGRRLLAIFCGGSLGRSAHRAGISAGRSLTGPGGIAGGFAHLRDSPALGQIALMGGSRRPSCTRLRRLFDCLRRSRSLGPGSCMLLGGGRHRPGHRSLGFRRGILTGKWLVAVAVHFPVSLPARRAGRTIGRLVCRRMTGRLTDAPDPHRVAVRAAVPGSRLPVWYIAISRQQTQTENRCTGRRVTIHRPSSLIPVYRETILIIPGRLPARSHRHIAATASPIHITGPTCAQHQAQSASNWPYPISYAHFSPFCNI